MSFILQIIDLKHSVKTNLVGASASSELVLLHGAKSGLETEIANNALKIRHEATVSKSIAVSSGNTLTITQSEHPLSFVEDVDQFLFVWHEAKIERASPLSTSQITLSQEATAYSAKAGVNALTLTQSVSYVADRVMNASNTLELQSRVNAYKPSKYWIG